MSGHSGNGRPGAEPDDRYADSPSFDVASHSRSYDPPEAKYNRSGTEMLSELHLFVIPRDTWKRQHKNPAEQIISDAISAGYVRVNAQSTLSDMRGEISRQIGFRTIPRDFLFLRLIGRYFTQVSSKQEGEVKAKYFLPPQAYSPELYLIDADSVTEPQPTARPTDTLTHHAALPSIGASVGSPEFGDYNFNDDDDDNDNDDGRSQSKPAMSRADNDVDINGGDDGDGGWEQEEERDEIEEKKRLKMLEEEEELLRRKKIDDEERRRRKIAERVQTPSPPRRLTTSERDAECMRILRKLEELKNRRQDVEKQRDRLARQAKNLQQNYYQKRHDARAVWKKRYFEEKKKTVPKEELFTELRQKLLDCHRKELAQLELAREAVRESIKRGETNPKVVEKANATISTTKLKNDIEDLSSVIQNTKMRLTSEMKLRIQSENELRQLKKDKALATNNWKDNANHSTRPTKNNTSRQKPPEKYDPPIWLEPPTYRSEKRAPMPIFAVLTDSPKIHHRPIDLFSHDDDDDDDDDYDNDDNDKKTRSRDLILVKPSPEACHHCGCNRQPEGKHRHRHRRVKDKDLLAGDRRAEPCRRCGGKRRKNPAGRRRHGSKCPDCNKRMGDRGGKGGRRPGCCSCDQLDSDVQRILKPGHHGNTMTSNDSDSSGSDSDSDSSSPSDGSHDSSSEEGGRPRCGCRRGGRRRGGKSERRRWKSQEPQQESKDGGGVHRRRHGATTPTRNHQRRGHDPDRDDDHKPHAADRLDLDGDRDRRTADQRHDTRSTLNHGQKKDSDLKKKDHHDPKKDHNARMKEDHDLKKDQDFKSKDRDQREDHDDEWDILDPVPDKRRPDLDPRESDPEKTAVRPAPKAQKGANRPKGKGDQGTNPRGRPYRPGDLDDAFRTFATKADGKEATNADVVKWCTDAEIFGKNMTSQHVDISFSKVKPKGSKTITRRELPALVDQMAVKYKDDKKVDISQARRQISEKLANASFLLHGTTKGVKAGAVDRLTDTTKYTGMHKARFNETGKGKGKDGQSNFDGYVTNYKMAGTYDDRH